MNTGPVDGLRWTARTWLLYVSGGGLLALAVVLHDSIPLFVAVPLLLAPAAAFLTDPGPVGPVPLAWEESGPQGTVDVHGRFELPAPLDSRDLVVDLPAPGELASVSFRVERRPGVLEFWARFSSAEPVLAILDPPRVRWNDALGLLARPMPVAAPPLPIERYPPEVHRLGRMRMRRTIALPGESRARALGESGQFHGVRPTLPGDAPRRINWRALARTGERFTNEFNLERTGDVLLFLDARPSPLGAAVDERLLGVMRAAAVGISEGFLREKARVGLAIFGEFVEIVPLGSGRTQRYRIRETLMRARIAATAAPSERGAVLARREFPPGPTTILLSSLAGESADLLVLYLRRRGFAPIVLSPSPIAVRRTPPGIAPEDDALAVRIAQLSRRQQLARVWRHAPVVDWPELWSLAPFTHFIEVGGNEGRRV